MILKEKRHYTLRLPKLKSSVCFEYQKNPNLNQQTQKILAKVPHKKKKQK